MKKKIIFLLVTVCMVLTLLPSVTAKAVTNNVSVTFDGTTAYYSSIDDAWNAAIECDTTAEKKAVIKLLADVSTSTNSLVNATDYLVLDTNGCKLTFTDSRFVYSSRISVTGGTLDIIGTGTIKGITYGNFTVGIVGVTGGSGSLTDATIINTGTNGSFSLYTAGSSTTFTVHSGTISSGEDSIGVDDNAVCTMYSGNLLFKRFGVISSDWAKLIFAPKQDEIIRVSNGMAGDGLLYSCNSANIEINGKGTVKLVADNNAGSSLRYGFIYVHTLYDTDYGDFILTQGTLIVDVSAAPSATAAFTQAPIMTEGSYATVYAGAVSPGAIVSSPTNATYTESKYVSITARVLPKENTPAAVINYADEKLTGLAVGAAYKITPAGGSVQNATADSNGRITIDSAWFGKTIGIVKAGNGTTTADSNSLSLTIPARPAAPETSCFTIKKATAVTGTDGTIAAVSGSYQYKIGDGSYTNWDGTKITNITGGTVYTVRYKSEGTSFASNTTNVTVNSTNPTTIVHIHSYNTSWSYDSSGHWYECSCGSRSHYFPHTSGDWINDKAATKEAEGSRHKECIICGMSLATEVIPKLTEGVTTTGTHSEKSAPVIKLENTIQELKEAVLSQKEQQRIENGESANIYLEVKDASLTITKKDKKLIEQKLGENTPGMYMDISLWSSVGEDEPHQVDHTNEKIKLSIKIPEELTVKDWSVIRTYQVVTVYNGTTSVLEGKFDEKTGQFTFEVNEFTTFALIYHDEKTSIEWVQVFETMKVGEKKTFSYEAEGINTEDIAWMTAKKSIAVVGKNYGKTTALVTAKGVGTDTLYLRLDKNKILKMTVNIVDKDEVPEKPETEPENPAAATKEIAYIVERGNTLTQIAKKYKTTVKAIIDRNKINNENLIFIGQKLMILQNED